jgi:hypothetical protein
MTANRLSPKILAALAFFSAAACITVNVNFPESAVQRAADDFVRDLYKGTAAATADTDAGTAEAESEAVKSTVKRSSKKKAVKPVSTEPTTWNFSLFEQAHAQEINTSTPKALELKAKMKSRVNQIVEWKDKGVLCEASDGTLGVANISKAGAKAGEVTRLVKLENKDRDELYQEVQDANRITDPNQKKIRSFFAAAFRGKGPACD